MIARLKKICTYVNNQSIFLFPDDIDGFEIDSNGAKTLNEIEYDHFRSCYVAYNQGSDTFADQENKLYWDLMDCKVANIYFSYNQLSGYTA